MLFSGGRGGEMLPWSAKTFTGRIMQRFHLLVKTRNTKNGWKPAEDRDEAGDEGGIECWKRGGRRLGWRRVAEAWRWWVLESFHDTCAFWMDALSPTKRAPTIKTDIELMQGTNYDAGHSSATFCLFVYLCLSYTKPIPPHGGHLGCYLSITTTVT